jgi:hypothetical protein
MKTILIGFLLGLSVGWLSDVAIIVHAQAHGTASEEVPRGAIDGVNGTYTLNFQPLPWGSIHFYRNGRRLQRNTDYSLGGPNHTQIIFLSTCTYPVWIDNILNVPVIGPCAVPQPGDVLLADYTY